MNITGTGHVLGARLGYVALERELDRRHDGRFNAWACQ